MDQEQAKDQRTHMLMRVSSEEKKGPEMEQTSRPQLALLPWMNLGPLEVKLRKIIKMMQLLLAKMTL